MGVSQWAPGLWVNYDDSDSWQNLEVKKYIGLTQNTIKDLYFISHHVEKQVLNRSVNTYSSRFHQWKTLWSSLFHQSHPTNNKHIHLFNKCLLIAQHCVTTVNVSGCSLWFFGLTCRDAGTSYPHKQWRDLVQKSPSYTERNIIYVYVKFQLSRKKQMLGSSLVIWKKFCDRYL